MQIAFGRVRRKTAPTGPGGPKQVAYGVFAWGFDRVFLRISADFFAYAAKLG